MSILHYGIGVTGSGKTTGSLKYILKNPTINYFIALPSIKAIDEKVDELYALLDAEGIQRNVKFFYSRPGQDESVVKQIAQHVEATPRDAGSIIFITHRAFFMMPHWYHADRWHGIVDEVPSITYCFSEPLPRNRHLLLDKLHMTPYAADPRYSVIDAENADEIKEIAVNHGNDKVDRIFQDLCEKLLPESPWQVFWDTEQIERFRKGDINKPTIHALMHPSKFDGFASMTILGADLFDSIFYHYYKKLGVEFRENRLITALMKQYCAAKGRKHDVHSNGARLTILRLTDRSWSKTIRDGIVVEYEGRDYTAGKLYIKAIEAKTKSIPKLWLANNDLRNGDIDGTRLPGAPQAFNQFQHYDCCVMMSALRPDKTHGKFLQIMTGMTDRQIRRAIASQVAIQAMGRGSIRNPDAEQPYLFICPDKDTSDDVVAKYPGCKTGYLLGYDPIPAQKSPTGGRPTIYPNDEERFQAKREQNRMANRRYRVRKNSTLLWTDISLEDDTNLGSCATQINNMAASELDKMATLWPEMNGQSGFSFSHWPHKRSKTCLSTDIFVPTEVFLKKLKAWQGMEFNDKERVPLLSPTMFAADLDPIKNRGKENALLCRGIILDFENSAIHPDEIPSIFPNLQMIVYSSFNHTANKPRYRVCIPSTHYVTPEIHEALGHAIEAYLVELGYSDNHGLDDSKFDRTSQFHRPSHRPEMFLKDYLADRQPFNPYEWVKLTPGEGWIAAKVLEEIPEQVIPALCSEMTPERKEARIAGAVRSFREHGGLDAKIGRKKLYWLYHALKEIGCTDLEAGFIMDAQTIFMSTPSERKEDVRRTTGYKSR